MPSIQSLMCPPSIHKGDETYSGEGDQKIRYLQQSRGPVSELFQSLGLIINETSQIVATQQTWGQVHEYLYFSTFNPLTPKSQYNFIGFVINKQY